MILSPGHPKIDPATRFCLCATCNVYNFGIVKQGNSRLAFYSRLYYLAVTLVQKLAVKQFT